MSEYTTSNVYLISGTDEAMIAAAAAKIVKHEAGEDPDPFALDVIKEKEGTSPAEVINQVIRSILSPPFLGGRKTVWLQNYSRFEKEGSKKSVLPEAVALRELARRIRAGVPDDIFLVISGIGIDNRKALAVACKDKGQVIACKKPQVRDRDWETTMRKLILERATEKGVSLERDACSCLLDVLGTDTARIDNELEKLICFCGGPDKAITVQAVEAVCVGQGEQASWALANALGERNLAKALSVNDVLMQQAKDASRTARSLLTQGGNCMRQLLQARVFMLAKSVRQPSAISRLVESMGEAEKADWSGKGIEIIGFHPYRISRLAEQSLKYTGPELILAIRVFRDAYWKCVTSSAVTRVVLEEALIRIVSR